MTPSRVKRPAALIVLLMVGLPALAADILPRLFFSDANLSFTFPNHWILEPHFPYGPLFSKTTRDGKTALISCAISAPLDTTRLSSDISQSALKQLAKSELQAHQPGYKLLAERDRELAGHNSYEINWENVVDTQTVRHQSVYFFVQNRVYAFTLQSSTATFRWAVPDFQHWLATMRILSRRDSGALDDPAHGGLWIHQTGGLKVPIPAPWLVAVSDDRTLGAVFAEGTLHTELTVTVDVSSPPATRFSRRDKKDALQSLHRKGLRIVRDFEEAFHGLPSYQVQYEGMVKDRVVKGVDIWVLSPKGRWLFNLEGDVSLYNSLTTLYDQLLKSVEFI